MNNFFEIEADIAGRNSATLRIDNENSRNFSKDWTAAPHLGIEFSCTKYQPTWQKSSCSVSSSVGKSFFHYIYTLLAYSKFPFLLWLKRSIIVNNQHI
jgi:hypothetical protein